MATPIGVAYVAAKHPGRKNTIRGGKNESEEVHHVRLGRDLDLDQCPATDQPTTTQTAIAHANDAKERTTAAAEMAVAAADGGGGRDFVTAAEVRAGIAYGYYSLTLVESKTACVRWEASFDLLCYVVVGLEGRDDGGAGVVDEMGEVGVHDPAQVRWGRRTVSAHSWVLRRYKSRT